MSTQFPGALDALSNPVGSDLLENSDPRLVHSTQHSDANDALEALETKVGTDNSSDPDSLDYKVRNGGSVRQTTTVTTASLASNASNAAESMSLGKGCMAVKVATDYPAWVRIYSNAGAQSADASRLRTVDPVGEHGVLLEFITSADNLSLNLAPAVLCYSLESSPGVALPITVTNLDSVSRAITITVTKLPLEG